MATRPGCLLCPSMAALTFLIVDFSGHLPGVWAATSLTIETDVMERYRVSNRLQCQRLCWYRKPCARFAFHTSNDNPGGTGDNCLLRNGTSVEGDKVNDGWIQETATGDMLPLHHGCKVRPCADSDICVPGVGYQCLPAPATHIFLNHPDVNDCVTHACQNGATCVDGSNRYNCSCRHGYTGTDCETDVDDCVSHACQNGATCVDGVNNYTCSCVSGYNGTQCQTAAWNGMPCSVNSTTSSPAPCGPDPGAACYSGQCRCRGDRVFSVAQQRCLDNCSQAELHNTYLFYPGWDLNGYDLFNDWADPVQNCTQLCSLRGNCRMFVATASGQRCWFKYAWPGEHPGSWATKSTAESFIRTCN